MCHRSVGNWKLLNEFDDEDPLIAYRTWLVINNDLTSWWKRPRFIWTPEMVATCAHDDHAAPQIDCSCGLHAFSEQVELDEFAYPSRRGVVALSGRVLVSDDIAGGNAYLYRAERARIVEVEERLIPAK